MTLIALEPTSLLAREPGLVLIAHGLNLKPSKMQALADTLCNERTGLECRSLVLPGHAEKGHEEYAHEPPPADTLAAWKAAILEQVEQAHTAAGERPLYFLGFSVGALAGAWAAQQAQLQSQAPLFDRMILIAPPIETRWVARLMTWIPGPDTLGIPSLNHEGYRVGSTTPLGHYRALYALQDEFREGQQAALGMIPTLMLVNPKDEMISLPRLQRRLTRSGWDHWRLEEVGPIEPGLKPVYQHLTIDEPSMGPGAWLRMQRQILEFMGLLPGTAG